MQSNYQEVKNAFKQKKVKNVCYLKFGSTLVKKKKQAFSNSSSITRITRKKNFVLYYNCSHILRIFIERFSGPVHLHVASDGFHSPVFFCKTDVCDHKIHLNSATLQTSDIRARKLFLNKNLGEESDIIHIDIQRESPF